MLSAFAFVSCVAALIKPKQKLTGEAGLVANGRKKVSKICRRLDSVLKVDGFKLTQTKRNFVIGVLTEPTV